jgi:phosphoribosylformimino-5-aminoimidazole carboxamide ribotide isomerase
LPSIAYPSIDLPAGRCVRLRPGRAEQASLFSDDAAPTSRRWAAGASRLHKINLDDAFGEAATANQQALSATARMGLGLIARCGVPPGMTSAR